MRGGYLLKFSSIVLSGAILAAMAVHSAEPARTGARSKSPARVVFLRQQTHDQVFAQDLLNRQVVNPHADALGRVHDVIIDHEGRVVGILLSVGGFLGLGDKLVGVPWRDVTVRFDGKFLIVNLSEEALLQAPEYHSWQQVQRWQEGSAPVRSVKATPPSKAIRFSEATE